MATYRANHVEFARFMKSGEIKDHIRYEAIRLMTHLIQTAPRSNDDDKTDHYAYHFAVDFGQDLMRKDRVAAFVYNDSPYATVLEVGSWSIKNPPRPMTRVLDAFPAKGG